ncbi:hypothetical protein Poli38472_014461 [Pythium oligandrum]|uniref:Kinesin motor domain-containing protein n=1 Tax=Pythium oligandrum TaxID=41045 RepID=A0A8K1CD83_PYTOL|nr:hypothetical protein Poli38472_014461 [Pythium oligandrum]|eukprot:TMW61000.1 hypothetical protein Poli38472_014461 [Pythium oligandrum]
MQQPSSPQVLLLMDSPRKPDGTQDERQGTKEKALRTPTLVGESSKAMNSGPSAVMSMAASSESLGRLLVEMTAQVQDERSRRSDVEKRNQALMLEIEQLQKEVIELKTSKEQRRRASGEWEGATRPDEDVLQPVASPRDQNAEFWWRELQEAKKTQDKAVTEAHQHALQVMELNACISMQHDELKALRASENDARFALNQAEERAKAMLQQQTILVQESQLLRDEVAHLNTEIDKRGVHFKALMDKWTESQAQSEHLERENHAMLEKMKDMRVRHEQLLNELAKSNDENEALQYQVNHLKGAVAAKTAESKAFQAYGTNARDHLQVQNAIIQRHQIYRRKVNKLARDGVMVLRHLKSTLATIRAPIVSIQTDFRVFLKNLQTPVFSLVARSRRYAEVTHIEHQPLRDALQYAERSRRHLHEQLWRARRNALLVCQIRHVSEGGSSSGCVADAILTPGETHLTAQNKTRTLRANYSTGELLLRESERETLTVKVDAIYSDRSREWNHHETVNPLLQSVVDGYNACVATFSGLMPLKVGNEALTVPEVVLSQLFSTLQAHGAQFHRVKLTISFLAVHNEAIYDLLGMDTTTPRGAATQPAQMSQIVVLEVQNAEEALLVLRGGLENLSSAHSQGMMDRELTHTVITACVTHEPLLMGIGTTKSKLQIVELAVGPTDGTHREWEDRGRVKAQVALENGLQSLVTTLGDVRVKDPTFVRYHSSKLTVLLQDTIKASAKFLGVVVLPGTASTSGTTTTPGLDPRATQVTRWLQHLRAATGVTPSVGPSNASADRSVEGFINRFNQQSDGNASSNGNGTSSALAFSSATEEQTRSSTSGDTKRWEKEYELMSKRYGDLNTFTTTFYQPASVVQRVDAAASPRRSMNSIIKHTVDDGADAAAVFPVSNGVIAPVVDALMPPPVPVKTTRAKTKRASTTSLRVTAKPRLGHTRATFSVDKPKNKRPTAPMMASTTLAPRPVARSMTPKVMSMHKLRRETASSALKKSLSTPGSVSVTDNVADTHLNKRKTPFR